MNMQRGWKGTIYNYILDLQGWFVLLLVGIAIALSTDILYIVTGWLSDLKNGHCKYHLMANYDRCCKIYEDINGTILCKDWYTWAQSFGLDEKNDVDETMTVYIFNYSIYVLFSMIYAGLSALFVYKFARLSFSSGLPEIKTILGGFIIKGFLGLRVLCIKFISIVYSSASGLSIGKLAPLIHISTCWGNIFSRQFDKYKRSEVKREIISASVAAGVSAAFGAPIGGVLYSFESMSFYFPPQTMWRAFGVL